MSTKEKIDKFLSKFISRKLMVFVISVIALFSDKITGDNWIVLSTAYIGIQGIADIVQRLKNKYD
jgi:hypothetical protein